MNKNEVKNDEIICICKRKTHGDILQAIQQNNIKNVEGIKEFTEAGTCCRTCVSKDGDPRSEVPFHLEEYFK